MTLFVGTSGWQYADWRGRVYPEGLAQPDWLRWYAEHFGVVEVNNTFYRLPEADTFAAWAAHTPADFVFVAKMSQYLTHRKRLLDPAEPVARFFAHAAPLGAKLGPVLVQLPPNLHFEPDRLRALLAVWPAHHRFALEVRHPSWLVEETYRLLADHDAALCLTDRLGRPQQPVVRTASWGYVRLHEGGAAPRPCYGDRALRSWVGRVRHTWPTDADVFVFFNNDPGACAARDAARFAALARRAGLETTRTPTATDVTVAPSV